MPNPPVFPSKLIEVTISSHTDMAKLSSYLSSIPSHIEVSIGFHPADDFTEDSLSDIFTVCKLEAYFLSLHPITKV